MTCAHATVDVAKECGENCCGVVTQGDSFEPYEDDALARQLAASVVALQTPAQVAISAFDAVSETPDAMFSLWERHLPGALAALYRWAGLRGLRLTERHQEVGSDSWSCTAPNGAELTVYIDRAA